MLKSIKFTTITLSLIILSLSLNAKDANIVTNSTIDLDKKILDYNKKMMDFNPNFKLLNQKIIKKEKLGADKNWFAYTLDLEITEIASKKEIKTPYFLFSNGEYFTTTMINLNTNERYGDAFIKSLQDKQQSTQQQIRSDFENKFVLNKDYYTKERFIAGNPDAKIQVAIFSDPLCVYCIKTVPMIIEEVAKRNDIALYYFNFPLDSIHPTSQTIIKAIEASKKLGIKDPELKIYKANLENFYDVYKTKDAQTALYTVNKILDTKLTLTDLDAKDIKNRIDADIKIGVESDIQGTPSILFNGSYVNAREKLLDIIKKK